MSEESLNRELNAIWGKIHAFEFLFTKLVLFQLRDIPNADAISFIEQQLKEYLPEAGKASIGVESRGAEGVHETHLYMLAGIDSTMKRILSYLGKEIPSNYAGSERLH